MKLVPPLHPSFQQEGSKVKRRSQHRKLHTILVVDPDEVKRQLIVSECGRVGLDGIGFANQTDAIDWLWERGRDVSAAYLNLEDGVDGSGESLAAVLSRDWPLVIVFDNKNLANLDNSADDHDSRDPRKSAKRIASILRRLSASSY